MFPDNIKKINI